MSVAETAPEAVLPAWQLNRAQWHAAHGVHVPWIGEISPVQYGRMSKAARARYDARRRGEWDAVDGSGRAYTVAVVAAYDALEFALDDPRLSADARDVVRCTLVERAAGASAARAEEARRANTLRACVDPLAVGDRVWHVLYRDYVTITKVNRASLVAASARDGGTLRIPARMLLQRLSPSDLAAQVST